MAILTFLIRLRLVVLAVLALAATTAAWFAFRAAVPVGVLFLSAASLAAASAVALIHLRHAGMAAAAVLAPLPGMIAAGPFAAAAGLAPSGFLAVHGLAAVLAAAMAGDIQRRILDSAQPEEACREALAGNVAAAAVSLLGGAALLVGWLFRDARALGLGTAAELAAAMASVFLAVPFAAASLPYGETFFVRANRARERRETVLRTLTQVVEPRWGMAVSGAVLVLATLGWFGAAQLLAHSAPAAQPALWAASALLIFLLAFAAGCDWRDALAATLALGALALLGLYLWGRAVGHLTAVSLIEIAVAATTALCLMLLAIVRSRRYRRSGDIAAVARLRALEDMGLAPWFGASMAAAAALPWVIVHGSIAMLALLFPLAAAAALIAMPALATALETLLPRRRSLNDLYGRG